MFAINPLNINIIPSFGAKKRNIPDKNQINIFEYMNQLNKDSFAKSVQPEAPKKVEKQESDSLKPKEILQQEVKKFLEEDGKILKSKYKNYSDRLNYLDKLANDKIIFNKRSHRKPIFVDTVLITLLRELEPDDKLRSEVVNKLGNRNVYKIIDYFNSMNISDEKRAELKPRAYKSYYTRMSIISNALLEEITGDKDRLKEIIANRDILRVKDADWFSKKSMAIASLSYFIKNNNYNKHSALQKIKQELTDYADTYTNCRTELGIKKQHPIEMIIEGTVQNL